MYLKDDFDLKRLKTQLSILTDMIKTSSLSTIKKVTNVQTIVSTLNENEIYKIMLQEVDKLLRLYLTFPVTTSTAETLLFPLTHKSVLEKYYDKLQIE